MQLNHSVLRTEWSVDAGEILRWHQDAEVWYSIFKPLFCSLILAIFYFGAGLISLAAASEQPGISPLWLPSGVGFAAFYIFGIRLWPGIFLGMYLIALSTGIPVQMAVMAALCNILAAAVTVTLLRYLGFRPELDRVKSVLAFSALAVIVGPMISASLGVWGFSYLMGSLSAQSSTLWLFWWLGNAIGIITLGGFLLSWSRQWRMDLRSFFELLLLALVLVYVVNISLTDAKEAASMLLLFLITPILLFSAIRHGPRGITLLGLATAGAFLITGAWIDPDSFRKAEITYLYLDIAYVMIAVFTGLIVSAAFAEQSHYQSLHIRAHYDYLTELFNRATFIECMGLALEATRNQGANHYLLYLDLDGVKTVNDMAGHEAGDQLIKTTAQTIRNAIGQKDCAGRLGGDEYAVLLRHCPLILAHAIADGIRKNIADNPFEWEGNSYDVTISIGGAVLDSGVSDIQSIVNRADEACYQAKNSGGDRVIFRPETIS